MELSSQAEEGKKMANGIRDKTAVWSHSSMYGRHYL